MHVWIADDNTKQVSVYDSQPPRPSKTRFFGTVTLNPEFYARDFGRSTSGVTQHIAAVGDVELEVRREITAVAGDGFDEAKVRTNSENAHTLNASSPGWRLSKTTSTQGPSRRAQAPGTPQPAITPTICPRRRPSRLPPQVTQGTTWVLPGRVATAVASTIASTLGSVGL